MLETKAVKATVLFALLTLLVSCAHTPKPGEVALNWSCKLRELQIQPTFPPREDVQVGDMYIRTVADSTQSAASDYCNPSTLDDFIPISVFLGTLPNMPGALKDFYQTRFEAPKTTNGQLSMRDGKVEISGFEVPESSAPSIFESSNLKRFRQVGFPDFMAVKVTGAELGAIVPMHGVMSDVGFGIEAVESAAISVPAAESYGLPASIIHHNFKLALTNDESTCKGGKVLKLNGLTYNELKSMAPPPASRSGSPPGSHDPVTADPGILVTVIREVFSTRAIDSSISFKQSFAAGINRDRSNAKKSVSSGDDVSDSNQSDTSDVKVAGDEVASDSATKPPTSPEAARRADAQALSAAVVNALGKRQGVPGITFNVRSSSSHGVGLTRVFDRPVVIGYREISYRAKPAEDGADCMDIRIAGAPNSLLSPAILVTSPASSAIKDQ